MCYIYEGKSPKKSFLLLKPKYVAYPNKWGPAAKNCKREANRLLAKIPLFAIEPIAGISLLLQLKQINRPYANFHYLPIVGNQWPLQITEPYNHVYKQY